MKGPCSKEIKIIVLKYFNFTVVKLGIYVEQLLNKFSALSINSGVLVLYCCCGGLLRI